MTQTRNKKIAALALKLSRSSCRVDGALLPSRDVVEKTLDLCKTILFPKHFPGHLKEGSKKAAMEDLCQRVFEMLNHEILKALMHRDQAEESKTKKKAEAISLKFLENLHSIRATLCQDLGAVIKRDPAAGSEEEVVLSYPGFSALMVHRLAHELYRQGVPLLPRIMSEVIHSSTGIDIHPGAEISSYCSIDHGTGLVIGETCIIGKWVSLYHNVTLGARSVSTKYSNQKRHPTVGNDVVIYPGATILGDIRIGDHSVIGGNAFILNSLPDGSKIYTKPEQSKR